MKNAFYFIIKTQFVLKIFMLLLRLFGHVEETAWLERYGLQTIAIQMFPNISQSKGNKTLEFGQLIEYSKRNTFLQKLCGKWGRDTSSRPHFIFWKSLKWGKSR